MIPLKYTINVVVSLMNDICFNMRLLDVPYSIRALISSENCPKSGVR